LSGGLADFTNIYGYTDGYFYRYYTTGPYNDGLGDDVTNMFGNDAKQYYPFTPVCFK
jgi:hypothetical protein